MNSNQAEIKSVKLGETLASNVEGNPEPSLENKEGVETRRRVCIKCGKDIDSQATKFCNKKCCVAYHTQQYRLKRNMVKKPGVGSGNNQLRENNHQWKGGVATFQKIAFEYYPHECNRCKSTTYLCVHHRDHNRKNNDVTNLEILCKACHQKHHATRDSETGRYIKG